jgi:protein FAM161A
MTENMQSIDFSIKPTLSAYNDKYFSSLISDHLTDTTNSEEFYNKLVELKNEQKKTLLYMQELYNQKQVLKSEIAKSENSLKDLKSSTNYPFQKDENYKYNLSAISAYETTPYVAENVKNEFLSSGNMSNHDLTSSKPPIPQRASTVTFQNINEQVKSDAMYDTISDDLKRIEKIWNEFSFNEKNHDLKSIEFNQRFEKVNVKKTDKKGLKKSSRPASAQVEWIPKVTIPEPFSMSIREKVKADNKKVTLARELQDEREKRIEAEIRECKKKFKATPIPAHVHLPLYEKKIAEEKLRKLKLKETSKEYLEKNSKPFNLTDMKKTSLRERRHSFTEGESNKTDRTEFAANPLPNFYFEDDEFVTQK